MNHYTQLTEIQRYQIYMMLKVGITQTSIARKIGIYKLTVSRELSRNSGLRGYRPIQAHQLALNRRRCKIPVRVGESHWGEIERLLTLHWSPEQINSLLMR